MTSVIAVFKPEPPDIDHECTPLDGIHDSGREESRESSSTTTRESQIPGLESLLEPKCELFDGIDPENPTQQSTVTPFVNAAGHVIRVPSSLASTILASSSSNSTSVPIYYSKSSSAQEARIRNLYSKLPQIITVHPPTSSGSTRDLAPNSSNSSILNQHSTSTIMVGPLGPVQNRGQVPIIRATTIMSTPTSAPTLVSPSSTTKTSGSHSSTIPIINSVLSSTFSGTIPASGVRMQPIMVVVRPDGTVQALPTPLTSSTVNCSRTAFMNGPSSFGSISSASKISLPSTSNNQFREYSRELTRTTIPIGNNQHRQISDKMAEKIRQFRELNAKYRALKKQKRLKRMRKFESQRRNRFWNGNRLNDVVEFCDPDDSNISSTNSNTNSFDSEATEVDSSTISSGTNVPTAVVPEIRKITAAISTVASISTSSVPISNLVTTSSGITMGRIILGTQASATRTLNAIRTITAIGSSTSTTISTASGTTNSSITISGVSGTGDGAKKVTKFVIPRDVLIKALAQQKQHQQQQQSGSGGITAKPLIYRIATSTGNVQFGIASSSLIRVAPVPTSSGSGASSTISTVVVPETSDSNTQQPESVSPPISTQPEAELLVTQNTDGNSTEDTEIEEESVPEPLLIPPPSPLKAIAIDVNAGVPRIKQFKILRPSVPKSPPEIVKSPPKVPSPPEVRKSPPKLPKSLPKALKPVSGAPSQRYPGGRPRKYPPGDPRYKADKRDQLRMLRKRKLANPAERKRQLEKARVNSRSYLERLTPEKKEARRRQALQCHKKRRQELLKDPVKREELKVERRKQYLRTLEKETPEEKIIRLNRARESHKRNRRAKYGPKKKVGRPRKNRPEEDEEEESPTDENSNSGEESSTTATKEEPVVKRGRGRPRKNPVVTAPAQSKIEPKLPTQSSNNIKKSNTKKISTITEPELPENQSSERRSGRKRTATIKFS